MPVRSISPVRICFTAAVLWFVLPQKGVSQDAVVYKWQRYDESGGRMRVTTQTAMLDAALPQELRFKLTGVIDAIAGASPTGEPAPVGSNQVPVAELHDRRKAWDADLSRPFGRFNLGLGFANSREHDYVSNGVSLNTATDFNQKNTTLNIGYSHLDDNVLVPYLGRYSKKRSDDAIVGVTQVIDPVTTLTVNLGRSESRGFLNDQYKIVQKNTEVLPGLFLPLGSPENRPREREKWTGLITANHSFKEAHGALEMTYRYFRDDQGIHSDTVELAWYQKLGERVILKPSFRVYEQSAADYYRISLDGTSFDPPHKPDGSGPYYSADYRISALRSTDVGFKAIVTVHNGFTLDASVDRYVMKGRDGITSESAYPRAMIYALGANLSF